VSDNSSVPQAENLRRFAGRTAVALNGVPQTVFHGTSARFDEFDVQRLGWNVDNPTTTLGFFFTDQREGALRWATRRGRLAPNEASPQVLEVHLAIENPRLLKHVEFDYMLRRARRGTIEKFKQDSMARGYDGLKIDYIGPDGQSEIWWVAFRPGQIKSATHNFGTFDPADPSITDRVARERAASQRPDLGGCASATRMPRP
jgi:hypothetical protein